MIQRLLQYVRNLWNGQETLGKRLVSSSAIVFFEKFVIKGVQFVRTIIVARILFPHDLGLFAMASLGLGVSNVLSTTGFSSALIYEKEPMKYLNSAWTVNVLRGTILSIVLFFGIAPLAGVFFKNEAVVPFARALSLVCFIGGFENIALVFFQKELQFIRLFLFDVGSFIVQSVVTIIAVLIFKNTWALILGTISATLTNLILSYVVHPYRPKFKFDFSGARHLFKFGKWVALTAVIGFLISQGDSAIVGRVLDASSLGYYQIAFALGMLPAVEIARSFNSILFPLYAKVRHDAEKLKHSFIRVSRILFSISIPASFGIFVLAPDIVRNVYGEKWLPLVPALHVLIFLGLIRSVEYVVNPLLLGMGRPRVQTETLVIQAVVMYALIIPLTHSFGMVGTALSVTVAAVVLVSVYLFKVRNAISLGFKTIITILGLPFVSGILMSLAIFISRQRIQNVNWAILLTFIGGGAIFYFAVLFALDKFFAKRAFYNSLIWIKENI